MNSTNGPEPKDQSGRFEPNPHQVLGELHESGFAGRWVPQDTALLIVHGIGDKQPFDTLDQFARTLVETCRASGHDAITMTHFTAAKPSRGTGGFWYDNFIRLTFGPQQPCVDIYEYYWAYQTGDKASLSDIQNWVTNVTGGARRFYRDNAEFGRQYSDSSPFFAKKPDRNAPSSHTNFRAFRYWFFITTVAHVIPATLGAVTGTLRFLSRIPIAGWGFDWLLRHVEERSERHR